MGARGEGEKNRRVTVRIAVIGFVGAILTAFIGSGSAWITAWTQAHDDSQAHLRDQRIQAYLDLSAETQIAESFLDTCSTQSSSTTSVLNRLHSMSLAVEKAVDHVAVYGSRDVASAAAAIKLNLLLGSFSCEMANLFNRMGDPLPLSDDCLENLDLSASIMEQARQMLVSTAHAEAQTA